MVIVCATCGSPNHGYNHSVRQCHNSICKGIIFKDVDEVDPLWQEKYLEECVKGIANTPHVIEFGRRKKK